MKMNKTFKDYNIKTILCFFFIQYLNLEIEINFKQRNDNLKKILKKLLKK